MMRNLRTQLTLTIMLIVLLTVTVISFLSNLVINREFERYIAILQRTKADDIVSNLNNQYNGLTQEWNIEYIHGVGMYALFDGYIIKVYDRGGTVIWDAENHDSTMCKQIMDEIATRMEEMYPEVGGEFITYDYELSMGGQKIGSMAISYYGPYFLNESDFRFLNALNLVLMIIGMISLLISFIISELLSRRIARPIAKTVYIAKQISDGNYSIRFEGGTKSEELDELTTSINQLAECLAEQESLRKRLTVDIAHELRTPLTMIGSHLEAMIEGVWEPDVERLQSCYEEIGRLSGLVADLGRLTMAEGDNLILNITYVDLMDIVRSCCANFEVDMKSKNLSLAIEGSALLIHADKDRLSQVMVNLLSNAIKYTLENGNIRIEVKDSENCGILIIEDDGIGIPKQEQPFIFERFYRTDKSRNRRTGGAGIGLAIVKSIITAHGGTVEVKDCAEHGSCFIVRLPK